MVHGYSDSNKGDLAIVVGSIIALRELYPGAKITLQSVFSKDDPEFAFHHRFITRMDVEVESMGIPSPYIDSDGHGRARNVVAAMRLARSWLSERLAIWVSDGGNTAPAKAVRTLKAADVVLLKGGQYIYNDQGGLRGKLYLWRMLNPVHVAQRLRKPVVMLGQSVGPLIGEEAREMTKRALALCTRLIVREDLSYKLLAELGLETKTRIAPDMAFLIRPRRPDAGNDAQLLEVGEWIGVTVVNWSFPGHDDPLGKRTEYVNALVDACVRLHREKGVRFALFPQVTVKHHGESDLDLVARVKAALEAKSIPVHAILEDYWPDEFSYLYSRCRVLIGTRLHSCILAACGSTPVVAIRYQGYKTEGVMASLGLSEFVHDIGTVQAIPLYESVIAALINRGTLSSGIGTRVASFRDSILGAMGEAIAEATGTLPEKGEASTPSLSGA